MANRLTLQTKLEEILGSPNVYYQPPESVKMSYPAIRFSRSNIRNGFANNSVYKQSYFYQIIVIDKKTDSEIVTAISKLPGIKFDRHYVSNNLNHDVFTLYW